MKGSSSLPIRISGADHNKHLRGKARADRQLSKMQRDLLVWLYKEEQAILASEDKARIKTLRQQGIPWLAKRFYQETQNEPMAAERRGIVSRTLARLDHRGLIQRYDTTGGVKRKPKTSHVKLTDTARHAAEFELEHGMTARQWTDELERINKEDMRKILHDVRCDYLENWLKEQSLKRERRDELSWLASNYPEAAAKVEKARNSYENIALIECDFYTHEEDKINDYYDHEIREAQKEQAETVDVISWLGHKLDGGYKPITTFIPDEWRNRNDVTWQDISDLLQRLDSSEPVSREELVPF